MTRPFSIRRRGAAAYGPPFLPPRKAPLPEARRTLHLPAMPPPGPCTAFTDPAGPETPPPRGAVR